MGIPRIAEYDIERSGVNVNNIVHWEWEPSRSLLLVHDMQQFFLAPFPEKMKQALVNNCAALIDMARAHDIPIVYTGQKGSMTAKERGLLQDFWGKGMAAELEHTKIVHELSPHSRDYVLNKWRYSAFFSTSLDEILKDNARDQIIICGVYAHIGILTTALDAYSRDIKVFVVNDATADFNEKSHTDMLSYAAKCCAKIVSTRGITQ